MKIFSAKGADVESIGKEMETDLKLIKECCDKAVESGIGGVVGHDDEPWFGELLADIGQGKGGKVVADH